MVEDIIIIYTYTNFEQNRLLNIEHIAIFVYLPLDSYILRCSKNVNPNRFLLGLNTFTFKKFKKKLLDLHGSF